MPSNRFTFLAILLLTTARASVVAAASLTPLGDLPGGGTYSRADGVSADGSVVVGYSSSASGNEAFRWTSDGGMVGLGDLPGGRFDSQAIDVSGDGSVVVGESLTASGYQAFRWTSDGGMLGLGKLPGAANSGARGVSGDGSVVVGYSDRDISREGGEEAFRWTSGGGMVGLGHLPGGNGSAANGVSDDGSVIVGYSSTASRSQAFRWTSDGGMIGLPGGINSVAWGVSADGSVPVGASVFSASHGEASRWTSDGGTIDLSYLPGGSYRGVANGISGDGSIVVGYNNLNPGLRAFYWTADGGMQSLWDVLLSHGVDPATDGWTELSSVRDITPDGNTIVGYGTRNGIGEAFVAVVPTIVPEPSAGALALLGLSSILLLRRRSARRPTQFLLPPRGFHASRQITRSNVCALLAMLLCTSAAARAVAAASLTPLGGLSDDGVYSVAHGVSADGSVVVGGTTNFFSNGEAFHWTPGGGMVGLGGLVSSEAHGVSGDGSVVVGRSGFSRSVVGGVRGEAFRWTPGGGMEALGTLPGGVESEANDVSDNGSVVVGWNNASATTIDSEAFRWTSAGGMVGLGYLPGGVSSYADAVSADGSVVVGFGSSSAFGVEAFRWTSAGGMVGLGTLPGGIGSEAGGVSADGSVIVGASTSVSGAEAFRWTSGGGMVGLGDQPGGTGSYASGVSGDGSIVVGFSHGPSFLDEGFRAFYWTANGGMRALWDVLHAHGVDPATDGWSELSHAVDISGDGNTIVGYGIRNDNHEAFVAVIPTVVPEPAAGSLALLGLGSILLLRRRRARGPAQCVPALVAAASLAALTAAPAAAVDTEPLNNSQLTSDSLSTLLSGTAISNLARLDGEEGDVDFFQTPLDAGEVLFGMVTPLAGLPANFQSPDTMVSVFDDSQTRTFSENDFASELPDFGEGRGSLFRFASPVTAVYRIGVSGCCDFAFDSDASGFSHGESGDYVLTVGRVNPAAPGGGFVDTDPGNQTVAGADLVPLTSGAPRVAVAELTDGDVDFFRLELQAGNALSAMTAPLNDLGATFNSPDTLLGLFDSSGTNLLVANEDAGGATSIIVGDENGNVDVSPELSSDFPGDPFFGFGSALRAFIPADGTYYLAVTGRSDDGFSGSHSETGAYALLVSVVVPEPSSALLAAVAIAACSLRRVVKPNRLRHALHAECKSPRYACATSDSHSPVSAMQWSRHDSAL